MTIEDMERGMKVLQDNMTVQGVIMYRLENNMDRLESNLARLEGTVEALANSQALMQAAMHSLFERMDRFIRGLQSDGHGKQ